MGLVVVVTSHRVAPGVLTWRAWELLRSHEVWTATADHPQLPFLSEAGATVSVMDADPHRLLAAAIASSSVASSSSPGSSGSSGDVVWLAAPDGDADFLRSLGALAVQSPDPPSIEVVHGSYDLPGARLLDLVAVMDRLRLDCPWTAKKTHESLAHFLIEEAYEALEALETGDADELKEELGDVLLQVVFHARIAEESGNFGIDDVAGELIDKLIRRHPHVFADTEVSGPDEVKANWDRIKAEEKGDTGSTLGGVPMSQPALALAMALQKRASRAGVPGSVFEDVGSGFGRELFDLVRRARAAGVDPEAVLREAAREFRARAERYMEDL